MRKWLQTVIAILCCDFFLITENRIDIALDRFGKNDFYF